MDYISVLIKQTSIMFITIIIGIICRKRKLFGEAFLKDLGNFLFLVVNPLSIFASFCTEYTIEKAKNLLIAFGVGLLMMSVAICLAQIFFKDHKHDIENIGTVINNCGFFGIPIISAVFGIEAVFYVAPYIVINNITQYSYGAYTMSHDKKEMSFKKVITNPNIIAAMLGLIVFFSRLPVPDIMIDTFKTVGSTMGTLCAIVIGGNLAETNLMAIKNDKLAPLVCFFRQILIGVLAIVVTKFINCDEILKYVLVVTFSTPVGTVATVFSRNYGQDAVKAARLVSISSLLTVITMPLVFSLISLIW